MPRRTFSRTFELDLVRRRIRRTVAQQRVLGATTDDPHCVGVPFGHLFQYRYDIAILQRYDFEAAIPNKE